MEYRGFTTMQWSILCTVLVDSVIKFLSIHPWAAIFPFCISLALLKWETFGSWDLNEGSSRRIIYWLFRLTILKGRDVFSSSYIWLLGSTGYWVGCWVCCLTLIFKVKICQSEQTWNRYFINQQLGKHKHRFIAKRSKLNLTPMAGCIS